MHGSEALEGSLYNVLLEPGEVIDRVNLWASEKGIHTLGFTSNKLKNYGSYGSKPAGQEFISSYPGVNFTAILRAAFSYESL